MRADPSSSLDFGTAGEQEDASFVQEQAAVSAFANIVRDAAAGHLYSGMIAILYEK